MLTHSELQNANTRSSMYNERKTSLGKNHDSKETSEEALFKANHLRPHKQRV